MTSARIGVPSTPTVEMPPFDKPIRSAASAATAKKVGSMCGSVPESKSVRCLQTSAVTSQREPLGYDCTDDAAPDQPYLVVVAVDARALRAQGRERGALSGRRRTVSGDCTRWGNVR